MIHGKVEINDKPILGWQAIRHADITRADETTFSLYVCEVYDYEDKSTVRFNVSHDPRDGAPALVQKIWKQFTEI